MQWPREPRGTRGFWLWMLIGQQILGNDGPHPQHGLAPMGSLVKPVEKWKQQE